MIDFNVSIIKELHEISSNSPFLNDLMLLIVDNNFIKGVIVVSLLWFFWFQNDESLVSKRNKIISVLISCLMGICIGRLLARVLPFSQRPVLNAGLTAFFPNEHVADGLDLNSSMPSDHAVMFFALATGIFLISKKVGLLTFIYVSCFVLFPRIYLGYHYATDIIAGAIVGTLTTLFYFNIKISQDISKRVLKFSSNYPGLFYLLFFWLAFQIGTMFDSSREIGHFLINVARNLI